MTCLADVSEFANSVVSRQEMRLCTHIYGVGMANELL